MRRYFLLLLILLALSLGVSAQFDAGTIGCGSFGQPSCCSSDAECGFGGECVSGICSIANPCDILECELEDPCSNGIQDGNEAGIDCGGDCPFYCAFYIEVFTPAPEVCNGVDDDGDNIIDDPHLELCSNGLSCIDGNCACPEGYFDCDGQLNANGYCETHLYGDVNNCGGCGNSCSFSNAQGSCNAGQCVLGSCSPGYYDANGLSDDGCEYACSPVNPGAEVCDGVDNNCDGFVDEGCDDDLDGYCDGSMDTLFSGSTLQALSPLCPNSLADPAQIQETSQTFFQPGDDCDDSQAVGALANPGLEENNLLYCTDNIDNDCDSQNPGTSQNVDGNDVGCQFMHVCKTENFDHVNGHCGDVVDEAGIFVEFGTWCSSPYQEGFPDCEFIARPEHEGVHDYYTFFCTPDGCTFYHQGQFSVSGEMAPPGGCQEFEDCSTPYDDNCNDVNFCPDPGEGQDPTPWQNVMLLCNHYYGSTLNDAQTALATVSPSRAALYADASASFQPSSYAVNTQFQAAFGSLSTQPTFLSNPPDCLIREDGILGVTPRALDLALSEADAQAEAIAACDDINPSIDCISAPDEGEFATLFDYNDLPGDTFPVATFCTTYFEDNGCFIEGRDTFGIVELLRPGNTLPRVQQACVDEGLDCETLTYDGIEVLRIRESSGRADPIEVCQGEDCECETDACSCIGDDCACDGPSCDCLGENCDCSGDTCTCTDGNCGCTGSDCGCVGPDCGCIGEGCVCAGDECGSTPPPGGPCVGSDCSCEAEGCSCSGDDCACEGENCQCLGENCECTSESCTCTDGNCGCVGSDCTCVGPDCGCVGEGCQCTGSDCSSPPPNPCTGSDCSCLTDACSCLGDDCGCDGPSCECLGENCDCSGDTCTCTDGNCGCTGSDCGCVGPDCGCVGEGCACIGSDCNSPPPPICSGEGCSCETDACSCAGDDCACEGDSCQCLGENCECTSDSCTCTDGNCGCVGSDCTCVGPECSCVGDGCACTDGNCNTPPPICSGSDCSCETDACSCLGEDCGCDGPSCECLGEDCDCSGPTCTCTDGNCGCTGSDCGCVGPNCGCIGEGCACTGDDCNSPPGVPCTGSDCACEAEGCACLGADCGCVGESCACLGENCGCNEDGCTCTDGNCGCIGLDCECVGPDCGCVGEGCVCTGDDCDTSHYQRMLDFCILFFLDCYETNEGIFGVNPTISGGQLEAECLRRNLFCFSDPNSGVCQVHSDCFRVSLFPPNQNPLPQVPNTLSQAMAFCQLYFDNCRVINGAIVGTGFSEPALNLLAFCAQIPLDCELLNGDQIRILPSSGGEAPGGLVELLTICTKHFATCTPTADGVIGVNLLTDRNMLEEDCQSAQFLCERLSDGTFRITDEFSDDRQLSQAMLVCQAYFARCEIIGGQLFGFEPLQDMTLIQEVCLLSNLRCTVQPDSSVLIEPLNPQNNPTVRDGDSLAGAISLCSIFFGDCRYGDFSLIGSQMLRDRDNILSQCALYGVRCTIRSDGAISLRDTDNSGSLRAAIDVCHNFFESCAVTNAKLIASTPTIGFEDILARCEQEQIECTVMSAQNMRIGPDLQEPQLEDPAEASLLTALNICENFFSSCEERDGVLVGLDPLNQTIDEIIEVCAQNGLDCVKVDETTMQFGFSVEAEESSGCGEFAPVLCPFGTSCGSDSDCDGELCELGYCGGVCLDDCNTGDPCEADDVCSSGRCEEGFCTAPACNDGIHNGDETDVDCGGSCDSVCSLGQGCNRAFDCSPELACIQGFCGGAIPGTKENADAPCSEDNECLSKVCAGGSCVEASCDDGIFNGDEAGVDCGGSCDNVCVTRARAREESTNTLSRRARDTEFGNEVLDDTSSSSALLDEEFTLQEEENSAMSWVFLFLAFIVIAGATSYFGYNHYMKTQAPVGGVTPPVQGRPQQNAAQRSKAFRDAMARRKKTTPDKKRLVSAFDKKPGELKKLSPTPSKQAAKAQPKKVKKQANELTDLQDMLDGKESPKDKTSKKDSQDEYIDLGEVDKGKKKKKKKGDDVFDQL